MAKERRDRKQREQSEDNAADENEESEESVDCSLVHNVGFGVVDTGCGKGLIGEETLKRHKSKLPSGELVEWEPNAPKMVFKYRNGNTDKSVGVVRLTPT